jgi:hypothetical protein
MAKSRSLAFAPRPIIVAMPRRAGRVRRAGARAVRYARRAGGHARRALPTVGIAAGGAVMGYLQGAGHLDFLPAIGGSKMVTLGIAGYAATRMSRNSHIRTAGIAALAAAAFDFGRVQGGGGTSGAGGWGWDE